jgi:hypothetical protein
MLLLGIRISSTQKIHAMLFFNDGLHLDLLSNDYIALKETEKN